MAVFLGPIGTQVGCLVSKKRASEVPYVEWFGLLSITYGLRETQEFMEERSKPKKHSEDMRKDVKYRMTF